MTPTRWVAAQRFWERVVWSSQDFELPRQLIGPPRRTDPRFVTYPIRNIKNYNFYLLASHTSISGSPIERAQRHHTHTFLQAASPEPTEHFFYCFEILAQIAYARFRSHTSWQHNKAAEVVGTGLPPTKIDGSCRRVRPAWEALREIGRQRKNS